MAQGRLDIGAIEWQKTPEQVLEERGKTASASSSEITAATGQARLPYIAPREAAELQATLLRNIQLQQDLLKSSKGERLGKDERTDLETLVSGFENVNTLLRRFKDDYTGSGIGFPTEIETGVQKRFSGFGTPGQANWWQSAKVLDMIERNRFFGASLTQGEKEAWQATTIDPSMDPKIIRENLRRRQEIVEKALGRATATLRAGGYRPKQIEAALGSVAPMFTPDKIKERQQFFASEAGTAGEAASAVPPAEGSQVGGEPIKGFRFSTGAEADILKYARSKDYTPEGYGALVAQKALEEGIITPEQQAETAAQNAASIASRFEGLTPEQRANIPAVDYSAIDKAAQENAGLGAIAMQAFRNTPESAVQLIQGLTALPADALASIVEGQRTGSIKTVTDLAGELVAQAGGDPQGPMTEALVAAMKERYSNPLQTFSTDPLGLLGDVSVVLTGGGTLGARAPGIIGRTSQKVATAGRVLDPLSAAVAIPEALAATRTALPRVTEAVTGAPAFATKQALGLTTGVVGGEGYGRAFQVGRERGVAGAPTAREKQFVEQMRGTGDADAVIAQADAAVRNMQEQASQAYRSGMVDVSSDATVLDFAGIDKTLDGLRSRAYYKGQVRDQRAATVYERMRKEVDDWKALDPAEYHTPEGMDALKQKLGDVADDMAVANDRKAAGIASGAYRAVREEIAKQVPTYAATMKNYEKAADTLRDIRRTFSLNPTASVDTKLRKLQSVMRNNANTNYGYRQDLAQLMEEQGGAQLMDNLSAQSISSWAPRGLASIPASTLGISGLGGVATTTMQNAPSFFDPISLALLPATSPRAVGEMSYYAGRGMGAAERGVSAMADIARPVTDRLAGLYSKYPAQTLALAQVGSRSEDVENQFLNEAGRRYGLQGEAAVASPTPPTEPVWEAPEPAPSLPEGSSVINVDGIDIALPPGTRYDPETREIVGPGGVRVPLSAVGAM